MMDTLNTIEIGKRVEQRASAFLQTKGLKLLTQNYRCPFGEIDLIMRDADEIVFVEVRLRNNANYGSAIETVDRQKQKKMIKTATHFLYQKKWLDEVNCRFDVIGISYTEPKASIEWIRDAFSADNE